MDEKSQDKAVEFEVSLVNTPTSQKNSKYFKIDTPKGKVSMGQQVEVKIEFLNPQQKKSASKLLKEVGKWVTVNYLLKLTGGFVLEGSGGNEISLVAKGFLSTLDE